VLLTRCDKCGYIWEVFWNKKLLKLEKMTLIFTFAASNTEFSCISNGIFICAFYEKNGAVQHTIA
jgi:hypothetical protein